MTTRSITSPILKSGTPFDIMHIGDEEIKEPNLLVPGKKPIGPVKINWTHDATKNLRHYFLANRSGFHNLVEDGILSCPMNGGYFSRETGDTTQYTYLIKRDSGTYQRNGSGWNNEISFVARMRVRDASTSWKNIVRVDDSDAIFDEGIGIVMRSSANLGIQVYASAYASIVHASLVSASSVMGEWINISYECDGVGGPYYGYVNGVQVVTGTGTARAWSNILDRVLLAGTASGNAWDLESFAFFSGRLGNCVHRSLGKDPYQFLEAV